MNSVIRDIAQKHGEEWLKIATTVESRRIMDIFHDPDDNILIIDLDSLPDLPPISMQEEIDFALDAVEAVLRRMGTPEERLEFGDQLLDRIASLVDLH